MSSDFVIWVSLLFPGSPNPLNRKKEPTARRLPAFRSTLLVELLFQQFTQGGGAT